MLPALNKSYLLLVLSFSEIYLNYLTEFEAIRSFMCFFYSIILQKIKISILDFNAIKCTYLLLYKTFPGKT